MYSFHQNTEFSSHQKEHSLPKYQKFYAHWRTNKITYTARRNSTQKLELCPIKMPNINISSSSGNHKELNIK